MHGGVDDVGTSGLFRSPHRGGAGASGGGSGARALAEAAFFLGVTGLVARNIGANPVDVVRGKLPELLLLTVLGFACFAAHFTTVSTVWLTRVRFLRKSDRGDPLYAILFLPLMMCVNLTAVTPQATRAPMSLPRFGLDADAEWRVALLPAVGLTTLEDPAMIIAARCAELDTFVLYGLVCGIQIFVATYNRRRNRRLGLPLLVADMPESVAFLYYLVFALSVAGLILLARAGVEAAGYSAYFLGHLRGWDTMVGALLFQCTLYAMARLARKNFTLGELSMACMFLTSLLLETTYMTIDKATGAAGSLFVFRAPTALLVYQLALIVGMSLIGTLLTPLLSLSRVMAQWPTRRLRWPDRRNFHRRLLALVFFVLTVLLVVGIIAPWVWWMLGRTSPWLYAARLTLQGHYWWSRLALLGYWGMLCNVAIVSLQLMVNPAWQYATLGDPAMKRRAAKTEQPGRSASQRAGTLAASKFGAPRTTSGDSASLGPAVVVSVNGRRKFFHLLALALFVPGIAWDVRTGN